MGTAVYQGTEWKQGFTFTNKSTGNATDITGWTFKAQFRARVEDSTAVLTLESSSGGFTIIDADNGRMSMNISAEQSADLTPGKYQFDVLRTDADPGPIWLFGGTIVVRQPVTREVTS